MTPLDRASARVLAAYTAAVFLSALLLFARAADVHHAWCCRSSAASPAVWSVAMVFFQSMLLAGYAYAHVLMRARAAARAGARPSRFAVRRRADAAARGRARLGRAAGGGHGILAARAVHGVDRPALLRARRQQSAVAGMAGAHRPSAARAIPISSTPRPMSAAFSALLVVSDPVRAGFYATHAGTAVERRLRAADRCRSAFCGVLLLRARTPKPRRAGKRPRRNRAWLTIARWVFVSAVPSGLLVAVTAHISTDVAAAPLLWVMPLSIYLLTWVMVFARRPPFSHGLILAMQPFAIAGIVVLLLVAGNIRLLPNLVGHLLAFFVIAMACHGELGAQPAGGGASDDVLSRALVRRHAGRPVRRTGRAQYVQLGRRISDPGRVGGAVPADRRRAFAAGATLAGRDAAMGHARRGFWPAAIVIACALIVAGVYRRRVSAKTRRRRCRRSVLTLAASRSPFMREPAYAAFAAMRRLRADPPLPAGRRPRRHRCAAFSASIISTNTRTDGSPRAGTRHHHPRRAASCWTTTASPVSRRPSRSPIITTARPWRRRSRRCAPAKAAPPRRRHRARRRLARLPEPGRRGLALFRDRPRPGHRHRARSQALHLHLGLRARRPDRARRRPARRIATRA